MERNGKGKLKLSFRKFIDFINQSAGGKGDMSHSKVETVIGRKNGQKIHNVVEVIKGLANSHKNKGSDFFAVLFRVFCGKINFGKHFGRSEVSAKTGKGRSAEGAAHSAAALGGNAKASAAFIGHSYAFNVFTVFKAEKIFNGSVKLGNKSSFDGDFRKGIFRSKLFAQSGGKVGHFGKIGNSFFVKPGIDLFCAERRLAHGFNFFTELFVCKRTQILHHLTSFLSFAK